MTKLIKAVLQMTKIECILRPNKLIEVKNALGKLGIHGMTITEAIGCGLQRGHSELDWNDEYDINLLPKTKVEVVVADELVDEVIKVIVQAARTGEIGDGKIFVYPIANTIRIRTGEAGDSAI
jgi:nitrogen regulatory protein PII